MWWKKKKNKLEQKYWIEFNHTRSLYRVVCQVGGTRYVLCVGKSVTEGHRVIASVTGSCYDEVDFDATTKNTGWVQFSEIRKLRLK